MLAASMRSSARRSVAVPTWLRAEMPNTMWPQRQTPGPASRPAKPSGTSRAPRTATDSGRTASRRSSPPQSPGPAARRPRAVRRAQDGQGEGGVGQSVAPAAHHVHADVQSVSIARLLKDKRRQLGTMTPGATRLSRLVGCALSLSVFSLWQSPHSACRVCALPAKATWSSSSPRRRCRGASTLSCRAACPQRLCSTSSSQGSWKLTLLRPLMRWRRRLRADHPVSLRVKEVGLVRELKASTCCFTRCATCSSVRCAGCLVMPPSSFTGSQSLRS